MMMIVKMRIVLLLVIIHVLCVLYVLCVCVCDTSSLSFCSCGGKQHDERRVLELPFQNCKKSAKSHSAKSPTGAVKN